MGVVVLIVLAAVWAAFLLPPILRARSEHRPSGSISDFRRQLHVLARSTPARSPGAPVPVPQLGRSRKTVKRRRDIFVGLLVAIGGSLVLGVIPQLRVLWAVHVIVDVLFVGYVAALVYMRNLAAERQMKVRFLPAPSVPEPALLYRRSAN